MSTTLTVKVSGSARRMVKIGDEEPVSVGPNASQDFPISTPDAVTVELDAEQHVDPGDQPAPAAKDEGAEKTPTPSDPAEEGQLEGQAKA